MNGDENLVDIPLYWLVNRDPYIGLLSKEVWLRNFRVTEI